MRRLSIIVPKEELHNLLAYAGQDQSLHLVEVPGKGLPEGAEPYEATNILARSSTIRNRITVLASALGTANASPERVDAPIESLEALADFLDKETAKLEQSIRRHEDAEAKVEADRERAQELTRFLSGLESAGVSLDALGGDGFLTLLVGEVAGESVQSLRSELDEVTYGNLIFAVTGSSGKTETFLAVFPSAFQDEARQAAAAVGSKLEPAWADLPTDPGLARKIVASRLEEVEQSSKQLEHDREVLVEHLGPWVKSLTILSEILEARARALSGSSATQATSMLQAWVPQDRIQEFTDGASKAVAGLVSIHVEEEAHETHNSSTQDLEPLSEANGPDGPPTLVRVPGWAKPLQSIINNFGIPSYNEMNPLPIMLISYPLIFGLMFGDIGQGPLFIVIGLVFLRLKRKGTKVPGGDIGQLFVGSAELLILLGIGITIFGFVFGDFFGFESAEIFGLRPLFSPTEGALKSPSDITHLQQFMVIILYFGVAHYTLGLGLNAYEKIRRREYSEAFFGPICWTWFYLAFVYMVGKFVLAGYKFSALLTGQPAIAVLPIALFFIPFGLLTWKEGPLYALEAFTSIGSNTLSYLRIWALNIADFFVKVALFRAGSLGGPAFAIAGAVGGNLLVMIIEGLIVFVQTLRLHWVEWFSKFYEGSGLPFAPYQEPTSWNVRVSG